jgi:hypothetical protein
MQFLPTRLPKIVLQRVEEEFPTWREITVNVMWPCADKTRHGIGSGVALIHRNRYSTAGKFQARQKMPKSPS